MQLVHSPQSVTPPPPRASCKASCTPDVQAHLPPLNPVPAAVEIVLLLLLLLLLSMLQIPVPSNWECYGHGTPIYTNCEWAGQG